ncbi:MAG: Holliday junction branch migration protein RuvA [Candidatus Pacebacteria bacterium]|nr:Holliday junction branch migration protein RuvA [Candidatus Paceibacterota bacterium]
MIRMLMGEVADVHADHLVLLIQGVGYKVATTPDILNRYSIGDQVTLHTHLAVRETALDLYGFPSTRSLSLFELLLTVSGIGPKSALNVLSLSTDELLISAVREGNASHLSKVSGIGKKTAEKIVLELKEKMALIPGATTIVSGEDDAIEGLRAMGYSLAEARDALKEVPRTVEGGSARIREALRLLGKK